MRDFTIGRAWSLGIDFVARAARDQAIILILVGALLPLAIQYLLVGGPEASNPFGQMGRSGRLNLAAMGSGLGLVMVLNYVLQLGSYFASWRIGLRNDATLGGALAYGMGTALVYVIGFGILFAVLGALLVGAVGGLGALVLMLLFLPVMAALYTVMTALVAVGLAVGGLLVMLFGAALGIAQPGGIPAAGLLGLVIFLAIGLLLLWAAARFSCAAPAMADEGQMNLVGALGESWRLTAEKQWRIVGHLFVVGLVVGLLAIAFWGIVGASTFSAIRSGRPPELGAGAMVGSFLFSVALTYVSVLVPAGIYRTLRSESDATAEVFA